jgi:hypothetical protein
MTNEELLRAIRENREKLELLVQAMERHKKRRWWNQLVQYLSILLGIIVGQLAFKFWMAS